MKKKQNEWVNPVGGYGDMLMVGGVLKQANDKNPKRKFNILRRTMYSYTFKNHPAVELIGNPPKNTNLLRVDYWSMEKIGPENQRPYQILARGFGLETPVKEILYIPEDDNNEKDILLDFIPWKKPSIVIAPASDSPRKAMSPALWEKLVDKLVSDGAFVFQVGRKDEVHIKNAYTVQGLTTPKQLIKFIKKSDLAICSDNFIAHAAYMVNKPAVVIWGPTNHKIYGYKNHIHIQMPKTCGRSEFEECIGPHCNEGASFYNKPCPLKEKHCIDQINVKTIYDEVKKVLKKIKK